MPEQSEGGSGLALGDADFGGGMLGTTFSGTTNMDFWAFRTPYQH